MNSPFEGRSEAKIPLQREGKGDVTAGPTPLEAKRRFCDSGKRHSGTGAKRDVF
jgi:hypothetical protein